MPASVHSNQCGPPGNPHTGGNPATIDYATADAPLGPWTYRGRILDTVTNTTTNHAAIVEYNGQWYVVYHSTT